MTRFFTMAECYSLLPAEIQHAVLQHVYKESSKKAFVNVLFVNTSWHALGVAILWREVDLRSLWYIRNSPNTAAYLPSIRSLIFGLNDEEYHRGIMRDLGAPRLPKLQKISFVPGLPLNQSLDYIIPYLQPSLREFCSAAGTLSFDFLSALKEKCGILENIKIKLLSKAHVEKGCDGYFPHWIEEMPSLRSISIFDWGDPYKETHYVMHSLLPRSTLRDLLKRPLRSLGVEYYLEYLEPLGTSPIFQSLRELSAMLRPHMVGRLREFEYLQKLHVRIDGYCAKILLPSISSMSNLRSLIIIFSLSQSLKTEHVMLLTNLSMLEELEIRTSEKWEIDGFASKNFRPINVSPFFDEQHFDQLASALPKMRHVCLWFDWEPNSSHVLKSTAFLWPKIEYLALGFNIDIQESVLLSKADEPFLPSLKRFMKVRLLHTDVSGAIEAGQNDQDGNLVNIDAIVRGGARSLRQAFPVLEHIEFRHTSDHQGYIVSKIYALWSEDRDAKRWTRYRFDWDWEFERYK